MSDECDLADELATAERDAALARVQATMARAGAKECADCGEDIPAQRRAAAPFAVRCVPCQQAAERVGRAA